jgi:hypothetical protein
MRAVVREQNVYRWAGNLIGELCDVRVEVTRKKRASAAAARNAGEITRPAIVEEFPVDVPRDPLSA